MKRRAFLLAASTLALALTGCGSREGFKATDITGADFAKDFRLTDHNGRPRTLADFKGKVVVVFFGYTHCPDVCPTTMADLASAIRQLGDRGKDVQVLFVTVDPDRDTPELLRNYVPAFNPTFLGLYGDAAATAAVAKEFKIIYQKQPGKTPESYTVDHSAGTYVFDREGRVRLFMNYGQPPDVIAHDLGILLG
jgi:protein SCO1/2